MMMCTKQCAAPVLKGKRCPKFTEQESKLHCPEHLKKFKPIYKRYKHICKQLEGYDVNTACKTPREKIDYLIKYYSLLWAAYKGRQQHKTMAFVPTLFDKGHDEQFNIILNKIAVVEDMLASLYEQLTQKQLKNNQPPATTAKPIVAATATMLPKADQKIMQKLKTFKKQRLDDAKKIDADLNKYIRENEKYNRQMTKTVNVCLDAMSSLCKGSNDYEQLFGLYRLLGELNSLDYFDANSYKPVYCKCGTCPGYKIIDVKLVCSCIYNYDNMREFLSNMHPDAIVVLRKLLETHRPLIKPVCADFLQMYSDYGEGIFCDDARVFLLWNAKLGRLMLDVMFDDEGDDEPYDSEYESDDIDCE